MHFIVRIQESGTYFMGNLSHTFQLLKGKFSKYHIVNIMRCFDDPATSP